MDQPFVVVNPAARNGKVGREWDRYRALLDHHLKEYSCEHTKNAEDTLLITRQALRAGHKLIGSLGGDGTHSLVVNGFFEDGEPIAPEASLAILPVGTGGDFRRNLAIEGKEMSAYLQAMNEAAEISIDLGHISYVNHQAEDESRFFLNVASFGMGGVVDHLVNTSSKALGGKLSFMLASARALAIYKAPSVIVSLDGEECFSQRVFVGAACNGQFFGGGMHIGPKALLNDGKLDLIMMPWRSRLFHMTRSSAIYSGRHLDLPGVQEGRGMLIEASAEDECLLDIDGEAPGRLPARIEVRPGAIRLKAPLRKSA